MSIVWDTMTPQLSRIQKKINSSGILGDVVYILMGMLLAIIVYHGLGYALGTSDPIVTVVSESMLPALDVGDMLVLKGYPINELHAGRSDGDIIVYYQPDMNKLIVHRLYMINDDGSLKTWGDNNPKQDYWNVQPEWVIGKVIYRMPYLGYPRIALRNIIGR